jgi:hypothetical protein
MLLNLLVGSEIQNARVMYSTHLALVQTEADGGLLKLHSRYGLQNRLPAYSGLLSRGFDLTGFPTKPLSSFHAYRQLHGWNPPPQVISADSAHC